MNDTFFKLVRPDYGSFYDPAFKWPVKGIVEVKDACHDGPCGNGLHLAYTMEAALKYTRFPFRVLQVKPLSPILCRDEDKIRVAKAESLGELPVPAWAAKLESRIKELPAEMRAIPWWRGTDGEKANDLVRKYFELLKPYGFKMAFEIEILTSRKEAFAAWAAACGAVSDEAKAAASASAAASDEAKAAASASAWSAAWEVASAAARIAAWDAAARGKASAAAWDAAWDAASAAASAAAWNFPSNPFAPLWECWKLGAWPIGFVGKTFKIYVEKSSEREL